MKEIIYDIGGGILGGKTLKGVIPGGSSFPVFNREEGSRRDLRFRLDAHDRIGDGLRRDHGHG